MCYKLFVYGTLKKGLCNHFYLHEATFLGEAITLQAYPLIAPKRWYPYLIDKPGKGKRIRGELYALNLATLKQIDRLEEHPRYYKRKVIEILVNGKRQEAFTYFFASFIPYWEFTFLEEFPSKEE
ncbi:gamma-glutamylcyclotransferase family protein [Nitratiruptor tergarcus]|uniref:Gamma-glutamylcyclotransferase family protein n=1 Tax=Nitratiruptor tergarcus DSM 16512 TaxID=1069081 RepID=A0A1W1WSC1_9BACT|nr:gamma-glutamylcyclotransferase family protein [Nitratiruptor tergarcus]SMC09105.1 Uncharacterized conserved protein YtfP, gamma-glutamylcyclotransferase (GGCT)/AIG2-like family [Nitratiruptor tergarcus DSM 16512]